MFELNEPKATSFVHRTQTLVVLSAMCSTVFTPGHAGHERKSPAPFLSCNETFQLAEPTFDVTGTKPLRSTSKGRVAQKVNFLTAEQDVNNSLIGD
jgi:hypothetical protein